MIHSFLSVNTDPRTIARSDQNFAEPGQNTVWSKQKSIVQTLSFLSPIRNDERIDEILTVLPILPVFELTNRLLANHGFLSSLLKSRHSCSVTTLYLPVWSLIIFANRTPIVHSHGDMVSWATQLLSSPGNLWCRFPVIALNVHPKASSLLIKPSFAPSVESNRMVYSVHPLWFPSSRCTIISLFILQITSKRDMSTHHVLQNDFSNKG